MRIKPKKSLRNILTVWFLFFSIIPLAFITLYSVFKYKEGIKYEQKLRLMSNLREFSAVLENQYNKFQKEARDFSEDRALRFYVATVDVEQAEKRVREWMPRFDGSKISIIHSDGTFLFSLVKKEDGKILVERKMGVETYRISGETRRKLEEGEVQKELVIFSKKKLHLIINRKILGPAKEHIGYVEQVFTIENKFLDREKERIGAEIFILDEKKNIVASSDAAILGQMNLLTDSMNEEGSFFGETKINGEPLVFSIQKLNWGKGFFYLGLGASQKFSSQVLRNVNVAFLSVAGTVVILLIISIFVTTRALLRPLFRLVKASRVMHETDEVIEVPVTSDTEIGYLTQSFNEMSHKIIQARTERKEKIKELEKANADLKQAQTQLVQSAKMASLGQLVAGVAHELNNPISFIHSNMSYLEEYTSKLTKLIETAERDISQLPKMKEELEYDYIREDLPKLIRSVEEGAQRTKEIVLGLRNFSRLDEASLKQVDIHEGLDSTLRILKSELKGRVEVEKDYGDLPQIHCYASSLNQVFMNILQNAAQAIPGEGKIWIKTEKSDDMAEISIKDNGKGMSDEVKDKIFDPFFTTKDVGEGTGLGMSISYGIVQKHQGQLELSSAQGKGTEFIIRIPLSGPPKA